MVVSDKGAGKKRWRTLKVGTQQGTSGALLSANGLSSQHRIGEKTEEIKNFKNIGGDGQASARKFPKIGVTTSEGRRKDLEKRKKRT